jgi:hypothetical protein
MKILRLGFGVDEGIQFEGREAFGSFQGKSRGTINFRVLEIHPA